MAIFIFLLFVGFVLGLSFYLGNKTKSSKGYFAAGGTIHWSVNGIAFAGDYLSAASFLGICGLIATVGYDGFLYSIGFLAGWIVALFVVAEPMKRMGKYTFTDALDAKFNSKGIQFTAALSTLIVSICYLIPQMVGAGALVKPLLGLPQYLGVIIVGVIVIYIVATAGMASTTYVQFLKGSMLIVFSTILVIAVLMRGLTTKPDQGGKVPFYEYAVVAAQEKGGELVPDDAAYTVKRKYTYSKANLEMTFVEMSQNGVDLWWLVKHDDHGIKLLECQSIVKKGSEEFVNGVTTNKNLRYVGNLVRIAGQEGAAADTGAVGPLAFLAKLTDKETTVRLWKDVRFTIEDDSVRVFYPKLISGDQVMRPGLKFKVEGSLLDKLDFISLMLALFFGTAALPHILIRYYTVPSQACARKSTIVAIASIGFFYVLTMYMGLGAMINSVVNPISNNMSAPLLAESFGTLLFAVISAIAFATVLGTVSGLIVAASGAVAHDIMDKLLGMKLTDHRKVYAGKVAAVTVGVIAIILGILFQGMNVGYLVGLAFAVAASANLPAILMLLFWKKTTAQGIMSSVMVGMIAALVIILFSPIMYARYGLDPATAPMPVSNPGIISIPLSFLTLWIVSLMTQKKEEASA